MSFSNDKPILGLSPLAGYTDAAFRLLASREGADEVTTEMVSVKGLVYNDRKTDTILYRFADEAHTVVQLFGREWREFEVAAKKVSDRGFAAIDINMGCPAPKIVKNGAGSALLLEPDRVYDIVRATVSATDLPVHVKLRMGIEGVSSVNAALAAERGGAKRLTVHGRTREAYYSGEADWSYIKKIKDMVAIPVLGNGDVNSFETFRRRLEETRVDGVTIGRGAIGNPFIFREIQCGIRDELYTPPSLEERVATAIYQLRLGSTVKGEHRAVLEMRKQLIGYLKGEPGNKEVREVINRLTTVQEVEDVLKSYLIQRSNAQ
ncbi:tRNA dihydrouridine synthase DusB [Peptoniphilus equinus]|uniref:tRNA-dihydrouridine synthase n=1 Tax=Peptoniphilus equinus TaxID=3016343 RepID=A0ABY7QUN6_9FIRM|nr:tRNA dihydrouridine synthase DusB [Peptoniphilus equinus]WBW50484.1 tRNA dihydrouridine synthase DusB [Peptoniphilus equinus]